MEFTERPVLCAELSRGVVVYALVDPFCMNIVRYVGFSGHPFTRYEQHAKGGGDVGKWFRSLTAEGESPLMVLIERCNTRNQAKKAERRWILNYSRLGQADLNVQIPREANT